MSDAETSAAIVTKLPLATGAKIHAGQVLVEISGRPVIALKGDLPVYRDLKPGTKGDDVTQLQKALTELGHSTASDPVGYFGVQTKAALSALYESVGYDPLPAQSDDATLLRGAEEEVTSAKRALEDARAVTDPKTSRLQHRRVQRAQQDLDKALTRLAEAKAKTGPILPVSEVVFLSRFPGRIDGVTSRLGEQASGGILTVSSGELEVRGYLQKYQKNLIRNGQKVEILSETSGEEAQGTVVSVADTMTQPQSTDDGESAVKAESGATDSAQGYLLTVKPNSALKAGLVGQDVRLTVQAATTKMKVLIVPVSAISAGADGQTSVTVITGGGERHRVLVITGTTGDGYVEVRPSAGGHLSPGEKVVVGVKSEAATAGTQ
ncbi:peptidoglycan-binding protein [Streptomyces minutiscleroticus]|uniref:peptidoglycan-binding protein n=1 Tax=Streptomyces minutiscleroticus TaxID=68238 RepID=UPI001E2D6D9A|nr:peptidoglycan-binding protein [Streptomyces minutiscleroticus]